MILRPPAQLKIPPTPASTEPAEWFSHGLAEHDQKRGTSMTAEATMMTIGGLAKKVVNTGMAAAVAAMLMLALTSTGAAAGACPAAILKCGCTISSPGNY